MGAGAAIGRAPLECNKGLALAREEREAHGGSTEGRRRGLPVQGRSRERSGQGTTAYGWFAEGAGEVRCGTGAGAGRQLVG